MNSRYKCVLWILLFFNSSALAGERFEFYNGVRSLGMGGVMAATVNDETALLGNPAALGKLRNYFVTVVDPELEIGESTNSMVDLDITTFLDPQDTLDAAEAKPGKIFHERVQLFPSFVVTNFGFGIYARYAADAEVDSTLTTYTYDYRNDFAFVFGFNFRLFDGRVKFGVNARAVNRVEVNREDIPIAQTGLTFETNISGSTIAREGFGVGSDAGLIFTAPWAWLPTLAFVYRDVGTTSYNVNEGIFHNTTNRPRRTPGTIDVGLGLSPITGKQNRASISVEMVDVLDAVEPEDEEKSDEVMRRLHAGVEFNFSDVFFLRFGANQGYWTAGIEIAVRNTQLQLASYGEEVSDVVPVGSPSSYVEREDRRYVAKFSYRF